MLKIHVASRTIIRATYKEEATFANSADIIYAGAAKIATKGCRFSDFLILVRKGILYLCFLMV